MSIALMNLVFSKRMGSTVRKAIFLFLADRADDHGRDIFPSKPTIAGAVDCNVRTVKREMKNFIEEGLLSEVGHRRCSNGVVKDYAIRIPALLSLPDAKERVQLVRNLSDGDRESPEEGHTDMCDVTHDHSNHPRTINKQERNWANRGRTNDQLRKSATLKGSRNRQTSKVKGYEKQHKPSAREAYLKRHFNDQDLGFCMREIVEATSEVHRNRTTVSNADEYLLKGIFDQLLKGETTPIKALECLEKD